MAVSRLHLLYIVLFIADTSLPTIRVNAPLSVREDSFSPITTSHLYITDVEATPESVMIYINNKPQYGNIVLEDDQQRGKLFCLA